MNKKVSSTSSKKNSFSKVIKIVLKLFLIVCTILTSTLLLLLSLNDPISLILNNNYKVSKAKITDSKLIIKDDKYEEYEFLKFEISYHFTTNDNKTVKRAIISLMEKYDSDSHGIRIIEIDNAYQFSTKIEMYDYLIKLVKQPKKYTLTDVVLETLSIIAYKQPVTRGEIEKIRGVSCDHAINKLIEYGLVEEVGRLDVPGRPLLFGTTEEFLRSFGVKKIDELPVLNPDQIEEFKQEVEKEVQIEISC